MTDPRLLVSIAVRDPPLIVLEQLENLRAFLPADAQIVLHLSPALGAAPIDVAWMLPNGVHVHPVASETADPHGDNVRWALDTLGPFTYVLLHGSDDLYFRRGAAEWIADVKARRTIDPASGAFTGSTVYAGPGSIRETIDGIGGRESFAVAGVPGDLYDPVRAELRARGRATGAALRLIPPFEANDFVTLTYAADVLADPAILASWLAAFGPEDVATLAVQLTDRETPVIDRVIGAITAAGGDEPDAPDIKLITAAPGSFAEAIQRWSIDALLRPPGLTAPPFLDNVPLLHPGAAQDLIALAATRGIVSSRA